MRIRLAATTVALATALTARAALPTAAATPASSASASANPTVQDILDHLPDDVVAGALIRRDGVSATAGPVTVDAHVRIGSVTKAFTNTVVLQLVAEHRIGLDAPARRYVPRRCPRSTTASPCASSSTTRAACPSPPRPPAQPTDPDGSSNP